VIQGLRDLREQNGQKETTLANAQAVQKQALGTLQTQLDKIETVDSAEIATTLSNVQNQLEATYKATASILNLSLLNFLK
jgi:hypothetical protein